MKERVTAGTIINGIIMIVIAGVHYSSLSMVIYFLI